MSRIVLVTGMAGAGRTTALKALEDMGFEAVDNLPLTLLDHMVRSGDRLDHRVAIGIDCRSRAFDPVGLQRLLEVTPRGGDAELRLLFLDCDDEILRRRFTETRRRHPLAGDRPVTDGIGRERQLIAPLREHADLVIDTSQLTPADLRRLLGGHFEIAGSDRLTLSVLSFAFRYGLPREADLVFDVRFLVNPHYVEALRPHTGIDPEVRRYVEADPSYPLLLERLEALLLPLLPCFKREGKSYLTIAFGCTGGRHRSIVVAENFAHRLRRRGWSVVIHHRDTPEANPASGVEPAAALSGAEA
jgi:RNase adapter protein RapZ